LPEPQEIYRRAVEDGIASEGWHPTWPVGTDIDVGTIGLISDGAFVYQGRIERRTGEKLELDLPAKSHRDTLEYATKGSVEFTAKVKGKTSRAVSHLLKAEAGVRLSFSTENALAISVGGLVEERVADVDDLEATMLRLNKDGKLDIGNAVVTHCLVGSSGIVAMSASEDGEATIQTKVDVGSGRISVANIDGAMKWTHQHDLEFLAVASERIVIAYRYSVVQSVQANVWDGSIGRKTGGLVAHPGYKLMMRSELTSNDLRTRDLRRDKVALRRS
jgi:hypothetical protein